MPYLQIPLATDIPANSQAQILQNFTNLNLWTNVDHYNIGSANVGKHIKVSMPNVSPAPVGGATESVVYAALSAVTNQSELYRNTNGAVTSMTEAGAAGVGFSRLASGILIKWGSAVVAGNPATVTMDINDVFINLYAIYCTPLSIANANPGGFVYPVAGSENLPANQFNVVAYDYAGAALVGIGFTYLVIGA